LKHFARIEIGSRTRFTPLRLAVSKLPPCPPWILAGRELKPPCTTWASHCATPTFFCYTNSMSDVVFYRKYRPQKFDDVLGQEHIILPLKRAVRTGDISHSYLFCGSRGTGKTSVARILAREIGCAPEDLYEMDAASNRGIDDVRELKEGVRTLPFKSPYKVYIIDEVHAMTKDAFNALLKTLEEPPKHVVFILATTEVGKLPETVVSRCEMHVFKKPTDAVLKQSAQVIAKKEGYTIEHGAADLIAMLGDGSFRDMQMVLQRVLGGTDGKTINEGAVLKMTQAPSHMLVNDILSSIAKGSAEGGLSAVSRAAESGVDFKLFLKLILRKLRFALLLRHAPEIKGTIAGEMSEDEMDFLLRFSAAAGARLSSGTLVALLNAYSATDRAYLPQIPLELALIKILGDNKE